MFAGPLWNAIGERRARTARWAGELNRPEIEDWLSRAAVFVSPVLYEPFGVTVRDAARAGAALVLSDIQIHREQWDRCALFVDPLDPASIDEAINRFACDDTTRSRLARAARLRAAEAPLSAQVESFLIAYGDAETARAAAI